MYIPKEIIFAVGAQNEKNIRTKRENAKKRASDMAEAQKAHLESLRRKILQMEQSPVSRPPKKNKKTSSGDIFQKKHRRKRTKSAPTSYMKNGVKIIKPNKNQVISQVDAHERPITSFFDAKNEVVEANLGVVDHVTYEARNRRKSIEWNNAVALHVMDEFKQMNKKREDIDRQALK